MQYLEFATMMHNLYVDLFTIGLPAVKRADAYYVGKERIGRHPILMYWKDGVLLPKHAYDNIISLRAAMGDEGVVSKHGIPALVEKTKYGFHFYTPSNKYPVSIVSSYLYQKLSMAYLRWRFPILREAML